MLVTWNKGGALLGSLDSSFTRIGQINGRKAVANGNQFLNLETLVQKRYLNGKWISLHLGFTSRPVF